MSRLVSEEDIRTLVFTFYDRVREDELLGPVFDAHIGDDWEAHLEKMCDFWSSILLATGRFRGNPIQAHAGVPEITGGHFDRWIDLFREVAHEVLDEPQALDVAGRSLRMRAVLEPRTQGYEPAAP